MVEANFHFSVTGGSVDALYCWSLTTFVPVVSMLVSTDIPTRSSLIIGWFGVTRILTVSRWTILVKFPVAFSGGTAANVAPEAGAMLSTTPSRSMLYVSMWIL